MAKTTLSEFGLTATTETLRFGGSIVHHHGIGKARAHWVREEYGTSFPMLQTLKTAFDPHGILNPGKLGLPDPWAGASEVWPD